mmetsp:Transcript_77115/g.221575  ORF Transcript_77115/g.221575 Transcript_77115/m.221575 type:complete len:337 (-) Transcript_77115:160-1170(-)
MDVRREAPLSRSKSSRGMPKRQNSTGDNPKRPNTSAGGRKGSRAATAPGGMGGMASDEMSRPGTAGSNPRKRGSMARSGLSLGLLPRSTPKGAFNENMNMQSSLMNRLTLSAGVSMSEVDPKISRPGTASSNDGRKSKQGMPFPDDYKHMSPKLYQRLLKREMMGDAWADEAEAFGDAPASNPDSRPTTPSKKAESQVLMLSPLVANDRDEGPEGGATPLSGGKPKGKGMKHFPDEEDDEPAEGDEEGGEGAMLDEWFLDRSQRKEMKTIMSLEKAQIGEVRKTEQSPRVPAIPSERARTARIRQKKAVSISRRNRPVSSGGRRPTSRNSTAGGWS